MKSIEINSNKNIFSNYKTCTKCKHKYLATSEFFYTHKSNKDGLNYWCKKCKREYDKNYNRLKRYNISPVNFSQLMSKQNHRCGICGRKFSDIYLQKNYHNENYNLPMIDHDHKSGKIRGILCLKCNQVLGKWNDNPLIFIKVALYLENNRKTKS